MLHYVRINWFRFRLLWFVPIVILFGVVLILVESSQRPPTYYFDENHYVPAGKMLVYQGEDLNPEHPPLGKWIIGWSAIAFGALTKSGLGFRLPSLLMGLLALGCLGLLLKRLGFSSHQALCAVTLGALNGLWFVHAKIATLDIYYTALGLGALALAAHRHSIVSIAAFALACSTKWSALMYFPILLLMEYREQRLWGTRAALKLVAQRGFALILGAFAVRTFLDVVLYRRFSLGWVVREFNLNVDIRNSIAHPYETSFWQWPFMLRPIWFHHDTISADAVTGVWAGGNPFIWALALLAFIGLLVTLKRGRLRGVFFTRIMLLVGFTAPLWFWGFAPAHAQYFYYFLPGSLWAGPLIVFGITRIVRHERAAQYVLTLTLLASALVFFYFLPVFSNWPLTPEALRSRMWFESWI